MTAADYTVRRPPKADARRARRRTFSPGGTPPAPTTAGGGKAHPDGACACPPERPELFAYRGRELCLGEDVKFMADLCKGNGWRVQNIGDDIPPQLARVMTREQR